MFKTNQEVEIEEALHLGLGCVHTWEYIVILAPYLDATDLIQLVESGILTTPDVLNNAEVVGSVDVDINMVVRVTFEEAGDHTTARWWKGIEMTAPNPEIVQRVNIS